MDIEPLFVTVKDVARCLSISRSKAYELIAKGQIPHVRIGKTSIRVPVAALNALADQSYGDAPEAEGNARGHHETPSPAR